MTTIVRSIIVPQRYRFEIRVEERPSIELVYRHDFVILIDEFPF
jgi:hypothetical protein